MAMTYNQSPPPYRGDWRIMGALDSLYTQTLGLNQDLHLDQGGCPRAKQPNRTGCWDKRKDSSGAGNKLVGAWVGQFYFGAQDAQQKDARIMALGQSMRLNADHGYEYDDLRVDKGNVRQGLWENRKKFFNSLFDHRLASYLTVLLATLQVEPFACLTDPVKEISDPTPCGSYLRAVAWDYCAFAQTVKCCVNDIPQRMWRNCIEFILRHEIEELQPSILLVQSLGAFDQLCSFARVHSTPRGRFRWYVEQDANRLVIGVPHPRARGANSWKRVIEFGQIIPGVLRSWRP